jgi:hypothetical protein
MLLVRRFSLSPFCFNAVADVDLADDDTDHPRKKRKTNKLSKQRERIRSLSLVVVNNEKDSVLLASPEPELPILTRGIILSLSLACHTVNILVRSESLDEWYSGPFT